MSSIEHLAPDQRATLMLIVQQGQSYQDLAELLSSTVVAVQARAHAALEQLGADVGAHVSAAERGEISDYLLGQQSFSQRSATRDLLARSPQAHAWARAVSADLQPLTRGALPEIPGAEVEPETLERDAAEGAGATAPATPLPPAEQPAPRAPAEQPAPLPPADGPAPRAPAAEPPPARTHGRPGGARTPERQAAAEVQPVAADWVQQPSWAPDRERTAPVTRLGGLAVILVVGAAIVVGIVLLVNSGGSSKSKAKAPTPVVAGTTSPSGPRGTGTTTSGGAPKVRVVATIPLTGVNGSGARGAAEIVREQGSGARALLVAGSGLKPSGTRSAYAVWLYNSPTDALSLGFFAQQVGASGQLEGTAPVPASASHFHSLVITLETRASPRQPGTIVLQGKFHT